VLVVPGVPAEEIGRTAALKGADLIVTGTHGRTGVRRVLMGSVAEQVLRTASCPVLTVRPLELREAA
jgi:nucleotide-binding universal stress UspA family protein